MLAAAGDGTQAEESDCGLERTAEAGNPSAGGRSRYKVGFFHDLLHGAQIGEKKRDNRASEDNAESDPRTMSDPEEFTGQRAVDLIEESERPERRGGSEQTAMHRACQLGEGREPG